MGNIEEGKKDFLVTGGRALGSIVATLGSSAGILLGTFARRREWNADFYD